MSQSLWVKLVGIFVLVILVGNAVVVIATNRAASGQIELYVTQAGRQWAEELAPVLAAYYARNGSWEGVESLLQTPRQAGAAAMTERGCERGMGEWEMMGMKEREGWRDCRWSSSEMEMMDATELWAASVNRLVLTDANGAVVADTSGHLVGGQLMEDDLARGVPVVANGETVGVLIATPVDEPGAPADSLLSAVNRSVLWASVVAGIVALALGSLLFLQMMRPLRSLARAAQGISAGDLSQRADDRGQDEVAQVARTFNEMASSLQRYESERRQVFAAIAHELRTPLSVIQGNLEAMLDGVLPANAEELALLHQEARLLNRLIEDLRTLSLADAGQLKLRKEPVRVDELVAQVVERLRLHAEEKKMTLTANIADDIPLILADKERLIQVLTNLVHNALRYTPPGARIVVATRAISNGVEISVSDNGPGIPPQDLPRIFERFWRGEKSRSRSTGGSGLGLAVVKQLVEAHGGRISVRSAPGKGAQFIIFLPPGY